MIVIGLLAAIAVPVYLQARRRAIDTQTKEDVTHVGQAVAAYYLDPAHTQPLIYGIINYRTVRLSTADYSWQEDVPITYGSWILHWKANATAQDWCVDMGNGDGSPHQWRYTNAGLESATCP